jgi:hypothetical protein
MGRAARYICIELLTWVASICRCIQTYRPADLPLNPAEADGAPHECGYTCRLHFLHDLPSADFDGSQAYFRVYGQVRQSLHDQVKHFHVSSRQWCKPPADILHRVLLSRERSIDCRHEFVVVDRLRNKIFRAGLDRG